MHHQLGAKHFPNHQMEIYSQQSVHPVKEIFHVYPNQIISNPFYERANQQTHNNDEFEKQTYHL